MSAIALQAATASYGTQRVFDSLTVSLPAGSLTALVGANGAGKSTLLKAIAGIHPLTSGSLAIDKPLAYLSQLATIQHEMPMTVLQTACTGFWPVVGLGGTITKDMQGRARAALHEVGLQGCETRQISELSGGQFQRLMFARLIIQDAPVVLLDEPFAAVDRMTVQTLLGLIRAWHQDGKTVLCVLHDFDLVSRHFPDTIYMKNGLITHGPTTQVLAALPRQVAG